jgi:AcrR family transcriptional regulator
VVLGAGFDMVGKKSKSSKIRLSQEARREAILNAVMPLFLEKSLDQVTTRDIAHAAEISEALLYQHFASKEDLYGAVQDRLCKKIPALEAAIAAATPSTESLVRYLYLFTNLSIKKYPEIQVDPLFPRLMVQSLIGDRTFANLLHERRLKGICQLVSESLLVAEKSGDLVSSSQINGNLEDAKQLFWYAVHLVTMVYLNQIGERPAALDPEETILDKTMFFILRGVGLKETAIKKHYNREKLDIQMTGFIGQGNSESHEISSRSFDGNKKGNL